MPNSRLFGLSAAAILVIALSGVLKPAQAPALSIEALRATTPATSATTLQAIRVVPVFAGHLVDRRPDLTDLGTSTTTTLPPTTLTTTAPAVTQPKKSGSTTTTAEAATTPPAPSVEAGPNGEYEAQFAGKINGLRSSNGLADLNRDGSLDSRARQWAEKMAKAGGLSHSNIGNLLPPWSAAAENVGMGGSVSGVFGALKGSSGHRSNMLGDFTHFGVGVWVDSSGIIWTAHVFTR
jgi:uncharacterized protein YkwD